MANFALNFLHWLSALKQNACDNKIVSSTEIIPRVTSSDVYHTERHNLHAQCNQNETELIGTEFIVEKSNLSKLHSRVADAVHLIHHLTHFFDFFVHKFVVKITYKLFYLLFTGPHYVNVRRKRKYFFKMVEVIGWLSHINCKMAAAVHPPRRRRQRSLTFEMSLRTTRR